MNKKVDKLKRHIIWCDQVTLETGWIDDSGYFCYYKTRVVDLIKTKEFFDSMEYAYMALVIQLQEKLKRSGTNYRNLDKEHQILENDCDKHFQEVSRLQALVLRLTAELHP